VNEARLTATDVRTTRREWPSFYLLMALVAAVVVVYGFSFTVHDHLLNPPLPLPGILWVHAAVFTAWMPLYIAQTALVHQRRIDWHRRLGLWGLVHGSLIPVVGVGTAIVMARLHVARGEMDAATSFPVPCFDMLAFTVSFGLAAVWRRRPAYHRRLMWIATAALTAAAFGRMPLLDHAEWFYVGVDALILLGALRDLIADGNVHAVYRFALPAMVAGQLLTAAFRWSQGWLDLAPRLFG
jgi:hypothetical protein